MGCFDEFCCCCIPCQTCWYSICDSIRHLKVRKFCCCITLKTGVYIIALYLIFMGVFPAYSLISRGSITKVLFFSAVKAIEILAILLLVIGTQTRSPKFIQIWLILATIAWIVKPVIMAVFIIWLDNQPINKRTHFQERTLSAELIVLAIVTVLNFVVTPYFLVVAKSFRSKLIKENERDYIQPTRNT